MHSRNASEWLQVSVDAFNGNILQVVNFKAFATYNVIPFQETNPSNSDFVKIQDPQNLKYSPLGWVSSYYIYKLTNTSIMMEMILIQVQVETT